MLVFQKIWHALFSCNTLFEIHPFVLLPTNCSLGTSIKGVHTYLAYFDLPLHIYLQVLTFG